MLKSTRIIARRVGRGRAAGALSVIEIFRGNHSLADNMTENGQSARQQTRGSRLGISGVASFCQVASSNARVEISPVGSLVVSAIEDDDGG